MQELKDDEFALPNAEHQGTQIEWSAYATKYDAICAYNFAYQENLDRLREYLSSWDLPPDARIADLGAGTGNFICAMADVLPDAAYTHVDFDARMNAVARSKYELNDQLNVNIVQEHLQKVMLPEQTFDLMVCVNVLYAVSPQLLFLQRAKRWLRPGGRFFVIDFGRKVNIFDWGWYFFRTTTKTHGVSHFLKALMDNYEFVRQNKKAQKDFENGTFWTHSTEEFEELMIRAGFDVKDIYKCYRDYCDLAICQ